MTHRSTAARVIYLGGLGRSGTTLLERLLGEIPGVAPLGEVVHLWARGVLAGEPCGCGAPFPACPFWREVGETAFGGWTPALAERVLALRHRVDRTRRIPYITHALRHRVDPARRIPHITHPDLAEYAATYRRLYDAAAVTAGATAVVDSGKHASLAFCLAAAGVDLHVVHVVRDPRAVAHSWRKTVARPEDGNPMTRWGPARTAAHWTAQNLALDLLAARGVRVTRLRYEDLLADPAAALAALAGILGLATTLPFLTGTTARLTTAHTASGNPMRFTVGPVELRRDDSWRSGLPRLHQRLVTALTWPLRLRYGYGEAVA